MPQEENYEGEMSQDLQVDIHRLHEQWAEFPDIFDKWGRRMARATYERDVAKDKVDLIKSELYVDIKASPAEYGIDDRVTEGAINAALIQELKYKKARLELNKLQMTVNQLTTGLRALSGKKAALENEVRLYLGNYFSEPIIDDQDFNQAIADRGTEATRPRKIKKRRKNKT